MANPTTRTEENVREFLDAIREGWSVSKSCALAGVARTTVYGWREEDPEFKRQWQEAMDAGTERLEDEMVRRAVEGTDKPVFYQGMQCGSIKEYSDTLLIFSLKGRKPEMYRESNVISADDGQLSELLDAIKRS